MALDELKNLQAERKILIRKIGTFNQQLVILSDPAQKFQLQEQIAESETRLQEVNDRITALSGIHVESGQELLAKTIAPLLERDVDFKGPLQLVNCDREDPLDTFWNAFEDKEEKYPFQFYFLIGCPSQKPNSFSERIIYEIEEEMSFESEDLSVDFIPDKEGRVVIEELPQGRRAAKSQLEFKKYFGDRFGLGRETTMEDYLRTGLPRLEYDYIFTAFEIQETDWKRSTLEYIKWIVESFETTHEDVPTFIFFFVLRMDDVHREQKTIEEQQDIITSIREFCGTSPKATKINILEDVDEKYLRVWLDKAGIKSKSDVDAVMDLFVKGLYDKSGEKKMRFQSQKRLDMEDIQKLQKIVYDLVNGAYVK